MAIMKACWWMRYGRKGRIMDWIRKQAGTSGEMGVKAGSMLPKSNVKHIIAKDTKLCPDQHGKSLKGWIC